MQEAQVADDNKRRDAYRVEAEKLALERHEQAGTIDTLVAELDAAMKTYADLVYAYRDALLQAGETAPKPYELTPDVGLSSALTKTAPFFAGLVGMKVEDLRTVRTLQEQAEALLK